MGVGVHRHQKCVEEFGVEQVMHGFIVVRWHQMLNESAEGGVQVDLQEVHLIYYSAL